MKSDPKIKNEKLSVVNNKTKKSHQKLKSSNNSHLKLHLKSLFVFTRNLFGKKSKKSFLSIVSHLLESYEKERLISYEEKKMIKNITSLGDKRADYIMTPRSDIIGIKHGALLEEIKATITDNGHTRMPVYRDNFDEIIGFIHSKDLAKFLCQKSAEFDITKIIRKILFVPKSIKIIDLLLKMRTKRVHIAVVLDEYGGVDGLVTIENVIEEIIGNIEDEHDLPSDNLFFRIIKIDDNHFNIGGRVEIEKLEDILGVKIRNEDENFETVGGLVMSIFNKIPKIGEVTERNNLRFKILDADSRSVKLLEVKKNK
jgi:magnesium and cobalt transporter